MTPLIAGVVPPDRDTGATLYSGTTDAYATLDLRISSI
jgi:hypothetical protein